ncbi:AEC family transporter [Marinomonas balearica]|uniref:AEC family transporter n=1 Tax=Marinomonas balearica TaxID=491947 RepID=A0A4R6M5D4_9GAMM|nr:AEC family transporter [Marinomonas balearica]TDO96276.1 hypothetical protein DFP79_2849 [Marinomonas balearica]
MAIILAVLPVFLLLVLGVFLRRIRFLPDDTWVGFDRLVYWVLFPALLFNKTSQIDLHSPMVPTYATLLLGALVVTAAVSFLGGFLLKLAPPQNSSLLQASVRYNTFITLAIAQQLYGSEGLVLATIGAAVLIPTINVFLVISMVLMHGNKEASVVKLVVKELFRNPLVLSIALGLSVNALGVSPVLILTDMTQILSQATLPLVLLAVGASVRLEAVKDVGKAFVWGSLSRMLVFPAVIFLLCIQFEVSGLPAAIVLLFGFSPTATSAYALARQLGGDAPQMAAHITLQTGLCLVTIPLSIAVTQWWLAG